jgi:hypothetical protein
MAEGLMTKYGIPLEIMAFIDSGFLELLAETEEEKTVSFHVPARRTVDGEGRITTYSIIWIHPDHNEQFCHFYLEKPGDLVNFYVFQGTTDVGDEQIDLNSVDELVAWLEHLQRSTQ